MKDEFGKREIILSLVGGGLIAIAISAIFVKEMSWQEKIPTMIVCLIAGIICLWFAYHKKEKVEKITIDNKEFPHSMKLGDKFLYYNIENKTFIVIDKKTGEKTKTYKFTDIMKYEVRENKETKVNCSIDAALVGDWLFGTIGAIVGAVNSSTTDEICNELKLFIYIKSFGSPILEFTYIKSKIDKTSNKYKKVFNELRQNCAILENMMAVEDKKNEL